MTHTSAMQKARERREGPDFHYAIARYLDVPDHKMDDAEFLRAAIVGLREWWPDAVKEVAAKDALLTEAVEVLRPFADFAGLSGFERLPPDTPMTQGSRMAARQVTASDFSATRAFLDKIGNLK